MTIYLIIMFCSHLINPVLHGEGRRPQIKLEDKDIGNVRWKQIPFRMAFSVHDNIYLHFTRSNLDLWTLVD